MLGRLRTNALLLEHAEEVLALQECHGELLRLCLYILIVGDILEEILRR